MRQKSREQKFGKTLEIKRDPRVTYSPGGRQVQVPGGSLRKLTIPLLVSGASEWKSRHPRN